MQPYVSVYLYYDEAMVQNPCTLEISYTLGCMKIHLSCIVKYSACGGGSAPELWHHSTSQLYYGFLM